MGVAVAMPYILVVNEEWKWYNQIYKSKVVKEKDLHGEVISKAKGFISWEHYVQDNTWTDFVRWESEEDANNATTVGQGYEVTKEFYACIQMNTCRTLISQLVKKY